MKNLLIALFVGLLCNLAYAELTPEEEAELKDLSLELYCSMTPAAVSTDQKQREVSEENRKWTHDLLKKDCPEDSMYWGVVKEYCSRDSIFVASDGSLLAPNHYLDGKLERETDIAIYRMKNIVRMYRPEFVESLSKRIEMWILEQEIIVWLGALLFDWKPLTPEYYMYQNFTEHRLKLAQMLNEISDELCPEGREFCGFSKHNYSDTAVRSLRRQAEMISEYGNRFSFEVNMESMAGSDYYKTCVGSARTWFGIL